MTTSDLHVQDLTVEYASGGGDVARPIDHLTLAAPAGSLVLLVGPSGCGKTTLLSCLAGILRPSAGTVRYGDTLVTALDDRGLTRYRRHRVGIVFQAFNLVSSLTATENVMVPLRAARVANRTARERAIRLLGDVGLDERLHHRPGELSGGQQQRVAIARALAMDPGLVIADEPTAHLDQANLEGVLRLLRRLTGDGRIVVVSTHDERLLPLADQVVELAPRVAPAESGAVHLALADGQLLFDEGDRSDHVYTVLSGSIAITRRRAGSDDEVLRIAGAGEWFGEMGPLFQLPRSAAARAVGPTVVEGCTVHEFRERLGVETLAALLAAASA